MTKNSFNEKVWKACKKIPKGKVTTYKHIASKLKTKAYRAVGNALRNNPNAPKTPCHRVIKSNRELGGYCGKLNSKKKALLLKNEGIEIKNNKVLKKFIVNV